MLNDGLARSPGRPALLLTGFLFMCGLVTLLILGFCFLSSAQTAAEGHGGTSHPLTRTRPCLSLVGVCAWASRRRTRGIFQSEVSAPQSFPT